MSKYPVMSPYMATYTTMTFPRRLRQTGSYRAFNAQQAGWPAMLLIVCLSLFNYDYATKLQQDSNIVSERAAAILPVCGKTEQPLKPEKFAFEYNGLIQLKIVVNQDPDALLLPDIIITTSLCSNAH